MVQWPLMLIAVLGAFAVGVFVGRGPLSAGEDTVAENVEASSSAPAPAGTAAVTGLGGIFFRSEDPGAIRDWYYQKLGVGSESGVFAFEWLEKDRPEERGYTVWGVFPATTEYFDPSESSFMVNLRVGDLEALVERLRADGVTIAGEIEDHPNGQFAWILDPEGRKVELWQPVPSAEDPYLPR